MNKNQKGFSVFEVLLIVLVISLLSLVGFTVWNNTKSKDNSDTKSSTENKDNTAQNQFNPVTMSEAEYMTKTTTFTFDLPDGWKATSYFNYRHVIMDEFKNEMTFKEGQPSEVTYDDHTTIMEGMPSTSLTLHYPVEEDRRLNSTHFSTGPTAFYTTDGVKGEKYEEVSNGEGPVAPGAHVYHYIFTHNGKQGYAVYVREKEHPDQLPLVESIVKSIHFL